MSETEQTPSLYMQLRRAGCIINSHQSDLYVLATDAARAIVAEASASSEGAIRPQTFTSRADGKSWIEIPFQYAPYWAARSIKAPTDVSAEWEIVGRIENKTIWRRDDVFCHSSADDDLDQPVGFHGRVMTGGYPSIVELATAIGLDYGDFVPARDIRPTAALSM